jgi:formylglycine-generating enzyme required for sulfatase activity
MLCADRINRLKHRIVLIIFYVHRILFWLFVVTALSMHPALLSAAETKSPSLSMPVGKVFNDCGSIEKCPDMVVIPPGSFVMGSPATEKGRFDDEGPQRKVTISHSFAMGRTQVTRGQFARFIKATNYRTTSQNHLGGCFKAFTADGRQNISGEGGSWRDPGFEQTDEHPVVCIGWRDAQAYIQWLNSQLSTNAYRLPTEAEWEYAARAGSTGAYPWGNDHVAACKYTNIADQTTGPKGISWGLSSECSDGYFFTAPAGKFKPNKFGLFDFLGNAVEWTDDCWHTNYIDAPQDGSAWKESSGGDCTKRMGRGAGWLGDDARSAARGAGGVDGANNGLGFRLAKTLP